MKMLGQQIDAARLTSEYSYWQTLSNEPTPIYTFQRTKLVIVGEPRLVTELFQVSVTSTGPFPQEEGTSFTLTNFYDVEYVHPNELNQMSWTTDHIVSVVIDNRLELWMKPLLDRRQCHTIISKSVVLQGDMWSWIHQVSFDTFTFSDLLERRVVSQHQSLPPVHLSFMKHAGLRIEEKDTSYEEWQTEWLKIGMDMLNETWLYYGYSPRPYFRQVVTRLIQLEQTGTIDLYEKRDVAEWLYVLREWGSLNDPSIG